MRKAPARSSDQEARRPRGAAPMIKVPACPATAVDLAVRSLPQHLRPGSVATGSRRRSGALPLAHPVMR